MKTPEERRAYVKKWRHDRGENKRFMGQPAVDLTGRVVGKLTVVGIVPNIREHKQFVWSCLCACGNTKQVNTTCLVHKSMAGDDDDDQYDE